MDYNIDIEIFEDLGYMILSYDTKEEGRKSTQVEINTVEGADLLNRFLEGGNFHGTVYRQDGGEDEF